MHTFARATVTLLTVVALTPISPAQAADAGTAQALDRIEAGTWSSADLALIRSQPELAAQVPDPTDPGTVTQLAQSSAVVYWRGSVVNQQAGIGTWSAWSYFQRHIEYCVVKFGCYSNSYPWSKITVYGNGNYSYTGSNE